MGVSSSQPICRVGLYVCKWDGGNGVAKKSRVVDRKDGGERKKRDNEEVGRTKIISSRVEEERASLRVRANSRCAARKKV